MQFAEHQISGRIGKLALAELRQLEDSKGSVWVLDEDARCELELLRYRLCSHPPRKLNFCDPEVPVFVFTDGVCEPSDDGRMWLQLEESLCAATLSNILVGASMGIWSKVGWMARSILLDCSSCMQSSWPGTIGMFFERPQGCVLCGQYSIDEVPYYGYVYTERQWWKLLRSMETIEMNGPIHILGLRGCPLIRILRMA